MTRDMPQRRKNESDYFSDETQSEKGSNDILEHADRYTKTVVDRLKRDEGREVLLRSEGKGSNAKAGVPNWAVPQFGSLWPAGLKAKIK